MTSSRTILLVGGFLPGQSLWSIQQGFETAGYHVVYVPSRGSVETQKEGDIELAQEEADLIPPPEDWQPAFRDTEDFEQGLARLIQEHRPELLLWWFSKDDCPPGLIASLRRQFPWLDPVGPKTRRASIC